MGCRSPRRRAGVNQQHVVLDRPADLLESVRAEARAGRQLVDVVQGATVRAVLQNEGRVPPHRGVPVPEGSPEEYVGDQRIMLALPPQAIAWNTTRVPDDSVPREIEDSIATVWERIGASAPDGPGNLQITGIPTGSTGCTSLRLC